METQAASDMEYYQRLDEFVDFCTACVERGQAYVAVMLCHELFRFLYPVEPFARFEQTDPVGFSVEHIRSLIATGRAMGESLSPYGSGRLPVMEEESGPLEKATSDLYAELWTGFGRDELVQESRSLLEHRLPPELIHTHIENKRVLDMGCGSGRYAIALAVLGAARVDAVDVQQRSFDAARRWCNENGAAVHFREGNVHELPFADESFDFVFCNGVLHHTSSIAAGVEELSRVMRPKGAAFLYLYGSGGIFWATRTAVRAIFEKIPLEYTRRVLRMIGMPAKRFIFCDTWYVPVETLTSESDLVELLSRANFSYRKLSGRNAFDLDRAEVSALPGARQMWGDGEHRYLLWASEDRAQEGVARC